MSEDLTSCDNIMDLLNDEIENNSEDSWEIPIATLETGEIYYENIKHVTNLLISGATGFGKTSFVRSIIADIMKKKTPSDVKFIIFDSKGVDYSFMDNSTYLMIPVIRDLRKIDGAINWMICEATNRIQIRDRKHPEIYLIIDDFFSCYETCSESLKRLFMIGRVTGLHSIIVSSTFTRKTLSKELSYNILHRVTFYLVDKSTSRFIIDVTGAESLLKPGEMIYKKPGGFIKGKAFFIDDFELNTISSKRIDINDISEISNSKHEESSMVHSENNNDFIISEKDDRYDELFEDAARLVIEKEKASIGNIQRVFGIGFNRAARIMDQLADAGVVGPEVGTRPRRIYMNMAQLEEFLNNM